MQKEDLAIPDMITQVKRDDTEEYSGGISARREKGEGNQNYNLQTIPEQ